MFNGLVQFPDRFDFDRGYESRGLARRALPSMSWAYLIGVAVIWAGLRGLEDRWWPASVVLYCPSWVFAIPLLVLLPAMFRMRRTMFVSVPAAALIVGFALMGLKVSPSRAFASDPAPPALRLLTCNVHRRHLDSAALARVIRSTAPDVVALQDYSDQHTNALFGDGAWHVQRHGELFLASRFPIQASEVLEINDPRDIAPRDRQGSAVRFKLITPRGPVFVINAHLASPHLGLSEILQDGGATLRANLVRRRYESRTLRAFVEGSSENLLIAGDLNTSEGSSLYRESWGDFENAFSEVGTGFGYTYSNNRTILRIDHILVGDGWKTRRCWVGPPVGSPHRPLIADFDLR